MQVFLQGEIAPALLQLAVTLGLAALFLHLFRRYRKRHFRLWSAAWAFYAFRLVCIVLFLGTSQWAWLYAHQVATGWSALGFLWAALVFSRLAPWRPAYLLLLLVPLAWSWIAVSGLVDFAVAAGGSVVLLSGATIWTGLVFLRFRRRTGSPAAALLAATLLLWGLHHLDYPLLRARGAWNPWGYYLDLLFVLSMGAAMLLLVIEEQRQGLLTLSALSGDLRRRDEGQYLDVLLRRPLALRGVQGAALVRASGAGVVPVRAAGACAAWMDAGVPAAVAEPAASAIAGRRPALASARPPDASAPAFTAILPLETGKPDGLAFVAVGEVAAPFAALDDRILVAIGEQIGAALENAELDAALSRRTRDLERLSTRLADQHEAQRRRLARELHDETAQVFVGLKLQLGSLREAAPAELGPRFERVLELVGAGAKSIRSVAHDLRPAVLDDLGLVPAIRALSSDVREWSGLQVALELPEPVPPLTPDAEVALFRAAQEALANVAKHAQATRVTLRLTMPAGSVRLEIEDDGRGLPTDDRSRVAAGPGRSGLFGLRERIAAAGGTVELAPAQPHGLRVVVTMPAATEEGTVG